MRSTLFKTTLLAALLAMISAAVLAQPSANPPVLPGRMFDGETIVYEGKLNKVLKGISVAEMTFTANSAPGSNDLLVVAEAVSKGTLLKIFRYSFLQRYESTIDLSTFRIMRTVKHDVQKERVRDGEALFDYKERRVTYVETDPKDHTRPPRRIASEINDQIYDMIAAIYAVRLLPLSVGKKIELSVSDSGLVYKVPVTVTAREMQKTKIGKVWCYRIVPDIFGTGRLIEQKGRMDIWMTEDARHIPVRAQVDTPYGKVDIKLRSISKAS